MYEVINAITSKIINPLVILLFAVALFIFIWGVYVSYIAKGGEEDRRTGARHILAGVIGMCIMISVFAIMHFIINTLNSVLGSDITPPSSIPQ